MVKDRLSLPLFPSHTYLRAIGPKTVHAERTLHFLSPEEYRAAKAADRAHRKQLSQQYGGSVTGRRGRSKSVSHGRSNIVINSISYDHRYVYHVHMSYTQYRTSIGTCYV